MQIMQALYYNVVLFISNTRIKKYLSNNVQTLNFTYCVSSKERNRMSNGVITPKLQV